MRNSFNANVNNQKEWTEIMEMSKKVKIMKKDERVIIVVPS
jgi:hypothetical protein